MMGLADGQRPVGPSPSIHMPMAADLYGDLQPGEERGWQACLPGLIVVGLGTLAAGFLTDHYGAPLTLMALLVGLALNFLSSDNRLSAGLEYASRSLLRWGIVLVGLRVTFAQILALGPLALALILAIVGITIAITILIARRLGFDTAFGALAGGAVAICGASAAMALAATLGEKRISQLQLTIALVGISALSATAMILYPVLAHILHLSNLQAGFVMGASIHDVAQSLGAGYSYSQEAGQIAAIVKLTRVALLAPILACVAMFLPRGAGGRKVQSLPWFVIGFFLMAGVNSLWAIPNVISGAAETMASGLLAAAVTATAIRSPLAQLLVIGPRSPLLLLLATLMSLGMSLAAAILFLQ
ncbi:YeiH family protein [Sphingobium sp. R-7]|uniref:YeiH family protein n=1 Tax=Sphingobium sp. R-7 TaxID=3375449 RepID=UPI00398A9E41